MSISRTVTQPGKPPRTQPGRALRSAAGQQAMRLPRRAPYRVSRPQIGGTTYVVRPTPTEHLPEQEDVWRRQRRLSPGSPPRRPNRLLLRRSERDEGLFDVSIVMPCLNEEDSIGVCVSKARRWLQRSGLSGEVIVVDNGSQDGSVRHATRAGARVVREARRGYGSALLRGIAESRSRYVVIGDGDDTYDYSNLDAFIRALDNGADIVVGNRYKGGSSPAP